MHNPFLGMDGAVLKTLTAGNLIRSVFTMPDGRVAALDAGSGTLMLVDTQSLEWGAKMTLAFGASTVGPGKGDCGVCYRDNTQLYLRNLAKGEPEQVLSWLELDISGDYIEEFFHWKTAGLSVLKECPRPNYPRCFC